MPNYEQFQGGFMRCAPVIVLRASSVARQGLRQLEHVPQDIDVVLLREHDGEVRYYLFGAETLRTQLSTADPVADLASELDLDVLTPAIADQLDSAVLAGTVALEGREVVGVLVDDDDASQDTGFGIRVRGLERPRWGFGVDTQLGGDIAYYREDVGMAGRPAAESATAGAPPAHGGTPAGIKVEPPRKTAAPTPPADPHPKPGLFRAYPDVNAPGQVGADETFAVTVGFSTKPAPSMLIEGPPITVLSGPKPEFIIQITGFGFIFPDGIQRKLIVDRDNPTSKRAEFAVRAEFAEDAAPRILNVSYEFAGAVVGRTWAQIQVMPEAPAVPATRAIAGGTGVVSAMTETTAPHLSVDIFSEAGASKLRWLFHSRYPDIVRPTGEVTTNLNDDSARSFAVQLMRQLPNVQPGESLPTMVGSGRLVADKLPAEFWAIFAAVWKGARAAGEEPRMQITITEAWIPWELAWIEKDRFDGAAELLGPDFKDGAALGQLWQVARWAPPTRILVTGDLPAAPPAATVDANEMAVIVGKYENLRGPTPLPDAVEEGNTIARSYGALQLSASDSHVSALLGCTLQRDGKDFEPTVVHFAGHAQTDLDNPQFTGLVLEDGRTLDPLAISGFSLVTEQQPFVFLNACEAGVADETLMNLGGLVGAFLVGGARGFIGPLWKVDDAAARDIAVEFYRRTFQDGETVSEAMRQIRRQFTSNSPAASELAYVFYGNPDLRLKRGLA